MVLYGRSDRKKVVDLRRHLRTNGSDLLIGVGQLRSGGGARRFYGLDPVQILFEPISALREGLRVGSDSLDVFHPPRARHQMLGDLELDFAADRDFRFDERIVGDRDRPLDRVFDRHDTKMRIATLGQGEYVAHIRDRNEVYL